MPSEEPLPVLIDAVLLEVALLNLVINSRDAMPEGGKITISAGKVSVEEKVEPSIGRVDQDNYALLEVSDTGVGMARETKEHAFETFFTTKEDGKGTGLGLSSVKDLVDVTGGFIQIDSELGRGTVVQLYLPLLNEERLR